MAVVYHSTPGHPPRALAAELSPLRVDACTWASSPLPSPLQGSPLRSPQQLQRCSESPLPRELVSGRPIYSFEQSPQHFEADVTPLQPAVMHCKPVPLRGMQDCPGDPSSPGTMQPEMRRPDTLPMQAATRHVPPMERSPSLNGNSRLLLAAQPVQPTQDAAPHRGSQTSRTEAPSSRSGSGTIGSAGSIPADSRPMHRRSLGELRGGLDPRTEICRSPDWQAATSPSRTQAVTPSFESLEPVQPEEAAYDRIRESEFLHVLKAKSLLVSGAPRVANARDQENAYLRKNIEHLRHSKRMLESQVVSLESRTQSLDQQNQQYKALYEQLKACSMCGNSGELEISSLHQQLSAVLMLKDALNTENIELQRRLQDAQHEERNECKHTACVICMDNLANVVCLPCKHLSLCTFCSGQQSVSSCPIGRGDINDKMQIFMP